MNGSNFIQSLESRTLFSADLPPSGDPGSEQVERSWITMEHEAGNGTYSPDGTGSGATSGGTFGSSANARGRFASAVVRLD